MAQTPPISLGEALPDELKRVIDLIIEYARIGPHGNLPMMLMKVQVFRALEAYKTMNAVEMVHAYKELKKFES